jgi:hypothetical protein
MYLMTRAYPNGDTFHSIRARHLHNVDATRGASDMTTGIRDRDVAAVCRKALSPDASSRYQSAQGFADDLEAWLARRPVVASAPSTIHRARLLLRRNSRLAWLTAAAILVSLSLGAILYARGIQLESVRAESERAEEVKARNRKSIEDAYHELQNMQNSGVEVTPADISRATAPILKANEPSNK